MPEDNNDIIYRIRNEFHEIVGSGPKSSIIKKIKEGKYTDKYEFSLPPYIKWQKLVSHPDFYELFIKKVLLGEEKVFSEEKPEQVPQKVEQNQKDEKKDTLQTNIIALFEEETPKKQEKTNKVEEIRIESDSKEVVKKKISSKRAIWILGIIFLVLLLYTFYVRKLEVVSDVNQKVSSQIGQLVSSITAAHIDILLNDAINLLEIQSIPFLNGALRILEEIRSINNNDVRVIATEAEIKSRLFMFQPQKKELEEEIKSIIRLGRKLDFHNSAFYRAEALIALTKNELGEAKRYVFQSLETDPHGYNNLLLLSEFQYTNGEVKEAFRNLGLLLSKKENSVRGKILLVKCALEFNDLSVAKKYLEDIIEEYPVYSEANLMLAEVMYKINQLSEAKKYYNLSGRLAKFSSNTLTATAYYNLGRIEESLGDNNYKNSYKLAYYYDSEKFSELKKKLKEENISLDYLKKLATNYEIKSLDLIELGKKFLKEKEYKKAQQYFLAATLLEPNNAENFVLYGEAIEESAYNIEDIRKASLIYRRAILTDPFAWRAYLRLGMLETNQLNLDQGLIYLKRAQQLAPQRSEVYIGLANHFMKRQDYIEALNYLTEAKKLDPANPEILYHAGKIKLIVKKDADKDTMDVFQQVYLMNPENYSALAEWLKLKTKNFEKNFAVRFVKELIEKESGNPNYYWVLGEIYATNSEHYRAIKYYHKALNLDNRLSHVRMSLAASLEATGDLLKAVAEYRLASILDKKNAEGYFKAAELCYKIKDYNSAEKLFLTLLEISPNYPGARRYLALLSDERGLKNKAIEEMEREVANNPENNKYILDLANLYLRYEMYEKAEKELQKITQLPSVSKKPEIVFDKIRAYLLLSRVYRALDRLENAESAINMALAIDSRDPELRKERGFVYYMQGRDQEGVQEFELYLKLKPEATDAKVIKALIDKMRIDK